MLPFGRPSFRCDGFVDVKGLGAEVKVDRDAWAVAEPSVVGPSSEEVTAGDGRCVFSATARKYTKSGV